MAVTISDIAREANVSVATVSRVLNDHHYVNPEKRQRILEIIAAHHYSPNESARKSARKNMKLIGVMVPDLSNNLFGRILRGIDSTVNAQKYSIIVCDTYGDLEKELKFIDILKAKGAEGIIFTSGHIDDQHLRRFSAHNLPVVFVCQEPVTKIPANLHYGVVNIDNRQAAVDVVTFLHNMGHRRIAFLSGPQYDPVAGVKRLEGYYAALKALKLEGSDQYVAFCEEFSIPCGRTAMQRIYESSPVLPTAVFCACDSIAIGAMEYLYDNGVSVPGDLSLVGVDDISTASVYRPSLTTVRQGTFEQGAKAAELLLDFIRNPNLPNHYHQSPYAIIRRRSVRNLHPADQAR